MKKENFICPCCGLPNHLEFKSEADYWKYLREQHSSDKFETNPNNYQFNRYILEENEEESDGRKKEIEDRFNLIKDYWNRYQDFEEWFGNEVVGFIPDEEIKPEDYIRYILLTYDIFKKGLVIDKDIIEKYIRVNLDNYEIDRNIHIPIDISDVEIDNHYDLFLENTKYPVEHQFLYNDRIITYININGGNDGSNNAKIINRGDN